METSLWPRSIVRFKIFILRRGYTIFIKINSSIYRLSRERINNKH